MALVSGDVLNRVFRFGSTIALARGLTLEEFGVFNTTLAIAGIVAVLSTVGLTDLGTREVAVSPDQSTSIAGQVLAIRLTALLGTALITTLALIAVGQMHFGLLASGLAMALAMTLSADWILRGLEKMPRLGAAWAIGGITVLTGSLIVAFTAKSATGAIWAYAAGEAAIALFGWFALRGRVSIGLKKRGWAPLLSRAWPVMITTIVIYAYTANLDTVIITATRNVEEAGLYSAPYRIFWALAAVTVFASYSVLPALARRSVGGDEGGVRSATLLLSRGLICYAAAAAGAVAIAGGNVIGFLFGPEFEDMKGEFTVLCASIAWYAIGFPAGQSLLASDQTRRFMSGAAVAGAVNLAGNLTLVPPMGPMGAAVATTLSFAIGSLMWLALRGTLREGVLSLALPALAITVALTITSAYPSVAVAIGLALLALAGGLLAAGWSVLRCAW